MQSAVLPAAFIYVFKRLPYIEQKGCHAMPANATQQQTIRPGQLFSVIQLKNSTARTTALHHHDYYELFFLLEGDVNYCVESRQLPLHAGDVMLVSPQELHRASPCTAQAEYERVVVWVSKKFMTKYSTAKTDLAQCFAPGKANILRGSVACRQNLAYCVRSLAKLQSSEEFGADVDATRCLLELLVSVNRLSASAVPPPAKEADAAAAVICEVVDYIHAHYCEDLSLDQLAETFFISKYHLSHAFQRQIGTSVYRYIIQKRLQMARQMLRGQTPPSEVYSPCGFGDYANFYRAFKMEYQMSPKQYLQSIR